MYKICVFAGTTEGRQLIEFLAQQPVELTACVATEYGQSLLPEGEHLRVFSHRMPREEMNGMVCGERFDLVIDATHPYAAEVTRSIAEVCAEAGVEYLRLLRDAGSIPEDAVFVEDAAQAVAYLEQTRGNILLTTGSKQLGQFAALRDFSQRVYARVLPMQASLEACAAAGLSGGHIIAMQGPFSREMNTAILRAVQGAYLVTKDSGDAGGFSEKAAAAKAAGAALIVLGRPPQRAGMSCAQVIALLCRRFGFTRRTRVCVVGIGPGNPEMLTEQARSAVEQAQCLIGAERMLRAVSRPGQACCAAVAPEQITGWIEAHPEYERVAVVLSGDCGFFSGAKKLLPMLKQYDVQVFPGISSLSCLCSRLGTSYEDVVTVSLHGREENLLGHLRQNRRVFVLVGGENGAGKLCARLTRWGFGGVLVHVGERLSMPEERIVSGTAAQLAEQEFHPLSAVLLERPGAELVVTHGLPDEAFQRGSAQSGVIPMTKSEVRAVCLSKLQLTRCAVCWDIGAGTGSVAIEMALQCTGGQVYAVERQPEAVELLEENRRRFGAENLTIVPGSAPEVCQALPAPTHVFVGGSGGNLQEILTLALEKNPTVRIVATAIALETTAELTRCLREFSWSEQEIVTLNVAKSRPAGRSHLMMAQNPITIFTLQGGEGRA